MQRHEFSVMADLGNKQHNIFFTILAVQNAIVVQKETC